MDRRTFVQAASVLPLVAGNVEVACAMDGWAVSSGPAFGFFDARFPLARTLARQLDSRAGLLAIDGDITQHWNTLLRPALLRGDLRAAGVTTPSFAFCLEVLARERASVQMTQRRVDRDLVFWSLRATHHG